MTSNAFLSFIVALSASVWLYAKFFKPHTMDTQRSMILAGVSFVVIFIIVLIIAGYINSPSPIAV